MAEPVVYVSTWKIKEGTFDEYRRFYAKQLKIIDEAEPQIVAFLAFANEDGTEMTHIHVLGSLVHGQAHGNPRREDGSGGGGP
jgi:hypothetical protein